MGQISVHNHHLERIRQQHPYTKSEFEALLLSPPDTLEISPLEQGYIAHKLAQRSYIGEFMFTALECFIIAKWGAAAGMTSFAAIVRTLILLGLGDPFMVAGLTGLISKPPQLAFGDMLSSTQIKQILERATLIEQHPPTDFNTPLGIACFNIGYNHTAFNVPQYKPLS
jgi:hypothetical protein